MTFSYLPVNLHLFSDIFSGDTCTCAAKKVHLFGSLFKKELALQLQGVQ